MTTSPLAHLTARLDAIRAADRAVTEALRNAPDPFRASIADIDASRQRIDALKAERTRLELALQLDLRNMIALGVIMDTPRAHAPLMPTSLAVRHA